MIDETRTLELFGYTSDSLVPGSHKKVVAVCDACGKVRFSEYRQYRDRCLRCTMQTDDTKTKLSESKKGKRNASYGKQRSERTKKKISEAMKGRKHSDEARKKMSDNSKDIKHSDETKKKIGDAQKGDKGNNWRGGISFEPYCPKFNEAFKESIREKFSRICFLCPKTEVENGKKLSVHHVDYDKNCLCDDVKCEFVPLCIACHSKTNNNRGYWENLIMEKLKDNSQLFDQFGNK